MWGFGISRFPTLPLVNVRYWLAGQTNPSKALVAHHVADPRAELERVLGVPVARIEDLPAVAPSAPIQPAQEKTASPVGTVKNGYGALLGPVLMFPAKPFAMAPGDAFTFSENVAPFAIVGRLNVTVGAMMVKANDAFIPIATPIGTVIDPKGLAYLKAREASEAHRVAWRTRAM